MRAAWAPASAHAAGCLPAWFPSPAQLAAPRTRTAAITATRQPHAPSHTCPPPTPPNNPHPPTAAPHPRTASNPQAPVAEGFELGGALEGGLDDDEGGQGLVRHVGRLLPPLRIAFWDQHGDAGWGEWGGGGKGKVCVLCLCLYMEGRTTSNVGSAAKGTDACVVACHAKLCLRNVAHTRCEPHLGAWRPCGHSRSKQWLRRAALPPGDSHELARDMRLTPLPWERLRASEARPVSRRLPGSFHTSRKASPMFLLAAPPCSDTCVQRRQPGGHCQLQANRPWRAHRQEQPGPCPPSHLPGWEQI
jgi:hypothetical protein